MAIKVAEYIYIDKHRVESYFEQLSPSTKAKKVPAWKVSMGMTGLSVERSEQVIADNPSDHDKIKRLVDELEPYREFPDYSDPEFILESLSARRTFIPTKSDHRPELSRGVAMWLSLPLSNTKDRFGRRYLIEDFPRDDQSSIRSSAFSVLWELFEQLEPEFRNSVIADLWTYRDFLSSFVVDGLLFESAIELTQGSRVSERGYQRHEPIVERVLESSGMEWKQKPSLEGFSRDLAGVRINYSLRIGHDNYELEILKPSTTFAGNEANVTLWKRRNSDISVQFAMNPSEVLENMGISVGSARQIDTLYRVRSCGGSALGYEPAIIGYPIFIAEHPSPFAE